MSLRERIKSIVGFGREPQKPPPVSWTIGRPGEMTPEEVKKQEAARQQMIHGITRSLYNIALGITAGDSSLQGEIKGKLSAFGSETYNSKEIVEAVGCLASLGPEADNVRVLLAPHLSTHPDTAVRWAFLKEIVPRLDPQSKLKLLERIKNWDPDKDIKEGAGALLGFWPGKNQVGVGKE
ncbi:MAG: hypothetical protein LiPW16_275 [Microgenomates group bacterium LiPW_16]|nr:MAG: hypothetical protein LiPW16_275 [Microgenomates group bacterium LiPW_16]